MQEHVCLELGWIDSLRVNHPDSWRTRVDFDCFLPPYSDTDDTLTLQVEHLVLFEVTIATTTQQGRMSIMVISS